MISSGTDTPEPTEPGRSDQPTSPGSWDPPRPSGPPPPRHAPTSDTGSSTSDNKNTESARPSRPPVADAAAAVPIGRSRGGQGGRTTDPAFPEELVLVSAWPDPVLDRLGHDPRSGYVERFWLSILGPSCLLLLRRLATELERQPDGFDLDTVQWASELGIGMKGGKNGPFWRAIERGCRFGAAQRAGHRLAVRRRLPPLTARQVERLPLSLHQPHAQWAEARLQRSRRPSVVRWSPYRDDGPDEPETMAKQFDDAA